MGVSYYIVLERDIPGKNISTSIDGKALAGEENKLKKISEHLGVKDLMSFFSPDTGDLEDFFDEIPGTMEIPETIWFSPEEGLISVRALLNYVEVRPHSFKEPERLIKDLKDFQEILLEAEKLNIKWHLAIDF